MHDHAGLADVIHFLQRFLRLRAEQAGHDAMRPVHVNPGLEEVAQLVLVHRGHGRLAQLAQFHFRDVLEGEPATAGELVVRGHHQVVEHLAAAGLEVAPVDQRLPRLRIGVEWHPAVRLQPEVRLPQQPLDAIIGEQVRHATAVPCILFHGNERNETRGGGRIGGLDHAVHRHPALVVQPGAEIDFRQARVTQFSDDRSRAAGAAPPVAVCDDSGHQPEGMRMGDGCEQVPLQQQHFATAEHDQPECGESCVRFADPGLDRLEGEPAAPLRAGLETALLAGRRASISRDDGQAGREHAQEVAIQELRETGYRRASHRLLPCRVLMDRATGNRIAARRDSGQKRAIRVDSGTRNSRRREFRQRTGVVRPLRGPRRGRRMKNPARGRVFRKFWSGKRDSNSRPQPWQGCALPTELFPRLLYCYQSAAPVARHSTYPFISVNRKFRFFDCLLIFWLVRRIPDQDWMKISSGSS